MNKVEVWPGHAFYRALWPGLLSLFGPGLGHIYVGNWRLGVLLYAGEQAFELALIAVTLLVPPTPVAFALWLAAIALVRLAVAADAVRRARTPRPVVPRRWYQSTWLAAIVMVAISIGSQLGHIVEPLMGWQTVRSWGDEDSPTLVKNDRVIADIRHPARLSGYGDVITYRNPRDNGIRFTGRVVGLAGDRVEVRDGILHINGKAVPKEPRDLSPFLRARPYASELRQYQETLPNGRSYMIVDSTRIAAENLPQVAVPADSVFVLRDNRAARRPDGRGNVPVADIVGILETVVQPGPGESGRLLSRVR